MRAVVVVIALVGCYGPTVPAGGPCSSTGQCPTGQTCNPAGICETSAADGGGSDPDGGRVDSSGVDGAGPGGWSTPVALTSLNSLDSDSDASLTADGLDIYFMTDRGPNGLDIYHASRVSLASPFGAPVRDDELSSPANDYSPEISGDGLAIYFTSNRANGYEVYRATRASRTDLFGPPAIESSLSESDDDLNVAVSSDGLVAIVDRATPAGGRELYQYTRSSTGAAWGSMRHLSELSSPAADASPTLDAKGLAIVFHSDRTTANSFDLWGSTRSSSGAMFSAPEPLAELNTAGNETNPWISEDGRRIVFARGSAMNRDLYEATR